MIFHLYAGGYGQAIHHFLLNPAGPSLRLLRTVPVESPSWLMLADDRLYAATERPEGGVITGFRVRRDGALSPLGALEVPGGSLCHLGVVGGFIAGANYGAGSLFTVSTTGEGRPDWLTALVRHTGHGPNPARQEAPHVHCCVPHPDGARLFSADLGLDRVFCYGVSADGGLTPLPRWDIALPGGAGPRHLVFSQSGDRAFVVTELSNEVYAYAAEAEGWRLTDRLALLEGREKGDAAAEESLSAAIRLSPDETRLYVSVRGADLVVTCAVGGEGRLTRLGVTPSGGHWPRDLLLLPDGSALLTANQLSGTIAFLPLGENGLPGEARACVACEQVTSLVVVQGGMRSNRE